MDTIMSDDLSKRGGQEGSIDFDIQIARGRNLDFSNALDGADLSPNGFGNFQWGRAQRSGPVPVGDFAAPAPDGRGGDEPGRTDELEPRGRVEPGGRSAEGDAPDGDG